MVYVNHGREHVLMNIAAIGGTSHLAAFAAAGATKRPESAEAPGAPDHDGDSDDVATKAARARPGSVDLHA
jgi:hypothetical protein